MKRRGRKPARRPKRPSICELKHLPRRGKSFDRRAPHARRYDLWPGLWSSDMGGHPWSRIELRIARNRAWMLREAFLLGSRVATDATTQGCVITSTRDAPRSRVLGNGGVVRGFRGRIATVLLNEVDLLDRPSEIGAHEMTHAAMTFMHVRGLNPMRDMPSEEALCYTVGELVRQLNNIFYAHAYRRPSR